MNRTWALSEQGREFITLLMASGISSEEFALRVAEHLVPTDELYIDLEEL